jgi:hypothetical protein
VSPSRYSTKAPRASSAGPTRCAIVVLPAPEVVVDSELWTPEECAQAVLTRLERLGLIPTAQAAA